MPWTRTAARQMREAMRKRTVVLLDAASVRNGKGRADNRSTARTQKAKARREHRDYATLVRTTRTTPQPVATATHPQAKPKAPAPTIVCPSCGNRVRVSYADTARPLLWTHLARKDEACHLSRRRVDGVAA